MAPSVLVTDGEERSSLAAVRSLGRAGYRVGVTEERANSLAGVSNFATRTWKVPSPLSRPLEYATALRRINQELHFDAILPMTEASLLALLPMRESFEGTAIPFPPIDRFRAITDKTRVASEARKLGIPVPRQVLVDRPSASSVTPPDLVFPLVLKPARSIGEAGGHRQKVGVVHVDSPDAYSSAVAQLPETAFPFLAQEWIGGTGAGVFLLMQEDRIIARFAHRRIREKPPSGGVSVCRESVAADPTLVEASAALLTRFDWNGIAMVEYRIADDSGDPYIMEVNPRLWGSLQLAIDAGVDFPRLMIDIALGKEVEPVIRYRTGVRTRWWWGEVDHFIARVREADAAHGRKEALRALFDAVSGLASGWGRQSRMEVFSLSDPAPFLLETADWLRGR